MEKQHTLDPHLASHTGMHISAGPYHGMKKCSHSIRPLYLGLRFLETPDFIGTVILILIFFIFI
jgi:hypothetical protein